MKHGEHEGHREDLLRAKGAHSFFFSVSFVFSVFQFFLLPRSPAPVNLPLGAGAA
jgi:hypothetical protein